MYAYTHMSTISITTETISTAKKPPKPRGSTINQLIHKDNIHNTMLIFSLFPILYCP
ncbi:hypothetical protein KLPN111888_27185 [Klebsiella pneumoniae]|nr:hypothetical protein SB00612_01709 [Klebsiella pneumoniae]